MTKLRLLASATAISLAGTGAGMAAHLDYYAATLTELNNSGVFARAAITLDALAQTMNVRLRAFGVEPGLHPQHIHGRSENGMAIDSVSPRPAPIRTTTASWRSPRARSSTARSWCR